MKKLTREKFIEKAKQVHGDKYDYSKVEYINSQTKVCIICKKHGEFWQKPNSHLLGYGCNKCAIEKRSKLATKTTDSFIERAKKVHDDKYDYSKVEYKGKDMNVCIICPKHGEFWQTPHNHLIGAGCPKCKNEYISKKYSDTTETFIEKARKVHGDKYDYSKVNYINSQTKVCIICPEHGEFWQRPNNHLNGWGCSKCSGIEKKTTKTYIDQVKLIHGDKYDYSKLNYVNNKTKVQIICKKHGVFETYPNHHLYMGIGCPKCTIYKLEKEVMDMLDEMKIKYIWQYKPEWLKPKSLDFYIPLLGVSIECQGEQHYRPIKFYGGETKYKRQVESDLIKVQKCIENNIKLIYYTNIDNIEKNENTFKSILEIKEYLLSL